MTTERGEIRPEVILKVTKEIVVKFIEMGKVSPASFDETFRGVYKSVQSVASGTDKSAKGQ